MQEFDKTISYKQSKFRCKQGQSLLTKQNIGHFQEGKGLIF